MLAKSIFGEDTAPNLLQPWGEGEGAVATLLLLEGGWGTGVSSPLTVSAMVLFAG